MFIGIDLGTSSVKTILIDHNQQILASSNSNLTVQSLKDGYSEQNPQEWIDATIECFENLMLKKPKEFSETISIGISGHMHGATLLDKKGNVIDHVFYGMILAHIKNVQNLKIRHMMLGLSQAILQWVSLLQRLIG